MCANEAVRCLQNKRRLWWLALLLGSAALLALVLITDNPRAELLSRPPAARGPRLAFLGGWNSPVRVTARRLRTRLFRPPGQIRMSAEVFDLTNSLALTNFILPRPVLSNESVQVWLLRTNELHEVAVARARQDAGKLGKSGHPEVSQSLSKWRLGTPAPWVPQLLTADGRPVQISMAGDNPRAGVNYFVVPRIRGQSVDVEWFVTLFGEEKIPPSTNQRTTNFAVGARLVIPPGGQAFLLTATNADGHRMGMTLSTTIIPSGK